MRRAGFTMIELIFVIVILGILAAVALPKFLGVSEQARAGKCGALVGTLNRTVFPSLWTGMAVNSQTAAAVFADANITAQITIPSECGTVAQYAAAASAGTGFTVDIDGTTYAIAATAATSSAPPVLTWTKQ